MSGMIRSQLFDLLDQPGNDLCADCECQSPKWASSSLGVFLCVKCVGIHRGLGVHCSITKSLELDKWTQDMYQFMASMGNNKANEIYTKNVPVCWKRPTPDDHNLEFYMEEWIRAKYDRKEFIEGNSSKQSYCKGAKDGMLMKKERQGNKWNPRYFRLSAETGSLSYYNKKEDLTPIKRMDIRQLNVILCNENKTEKFYSMEIIVPEEREKKKQRRSFSRSIFVSGATAKEIVDWYLSIRSARLIALDLNSSDPEVSAILSTNRIKEGHLRKSGPKEHERYLERWITVESNKFAYYENKMDATPKDEVILCASPGYGVCEGVDGKHPDEPHPFMVSTPDRVYNFGAETQSEMEEWINAFRIAIESEPLETRRFQRISVVSAASQLSEISVSSSESSGST